MGTALDGPLDRDGQAAWGVDEEHCAGLVDVDQAEMDLHPDGVRVATAHHDGYVRITRLAVGKG